MVLICGVDYDDQEEADGFRPLTGIMVLIFTR